MVQINVNSLKFPGKAPQPPEARGSGGGTRAGSRLSEAPPQKWC